MDILFLGKDAGFIRKLRHAFINLYSKSNVTTTLSNNNVGVKKIKANVTISRSEQFCGYDARTPTYILKIL